MLLIDGDVESNPGSAYNIQKSVLGSFHQAHTKFGNSAGIQCSCNALYALCFSIIKRVSLWKSFDLDYIQSGNNRDPGVPDPGGENFPGSGSGSSTAVPPASTGGILFILGSSGSLISQHHARLKDLE